MRRHAVVVGGLALAALLGLVVGAPTTAQTPTSAPAEVAAPAVGSPAASPATSPSAVAGTPAPATPAPATLAGCLTDPAPPPTRASVNDTAGNRLDRVTRPIGADPAGIAIDSTDTWGRVFVASRGDDRITVLYGRSPDLVVACVLPIAGTPNDLAVDDATGNVLVTLRDRPGLLVLDGRSDPPSALLEIAMPGVPGQVVVDQEAHRAWVSVPEAGRVVGLEQVEGAWRATSAFDAGEWPTFLAVDPERQRLVVGAQGQPPDQDGDAGKGLILVFDLTGGTPKPVGEPIPASVPTGVMIDPRSGSATVLENGIDGLATLMWPADAGPDATPDVVRVPLPDVEQSAGQNPVDLALLPGARELVVTMVSQVAPEGGGHLDAFKLNDAGRTAFDRSIPAGRQTRGIALDPSTGRIFVTELEGGLLAAYAGAGADTPTAPPPPPATLAESMPSPLQVSFAPQDIARTVGISLLVLLLVGAPTPVFNETLESHLDEIQGWWGRRLRRGREGAGRAKAAGARVAEAARRFSASPVGILAYVLLAALIYSFLTPGFPFENGPLVFGVAVVGLVLATAADILPGDRYVVRRYQTHGRVRVALWTLLLAGVCVLISRLANLNPGYMYGIIGTFTFAVALTRKDEGKMEALGAVALLILALVVWILRVPFQPEPGVPATGTQLIIGSALVGIFVVCVEGLVFGLIPMSFLPGQKIFRWSRLAWALLWGAGLALFAHVLVYPVTVATPNPDPSSLQATLLSVGLYGAIAVLFWAGFRWHDGRVARAQHGGDPGT